jgi:hypothetical protein
LAQDAIAQLPRILFGVHGDPDLLAGSGVSEQPVTALPMADFDEAGGLQFPDHFGPRHPIIITYR